MAQTTVPISTSAAQEFCKICENATKNKKHVAREMMFGLEGQFTYLECSQCGCLQLLNIPGDIGNYYPSNYYSFQKQGWLKTLLRHQLASYSFGKPNPIGWLFSSIYGSNVMYLRHISASKDAHILDVGCGSGKMLDDLHWLGFKHLDGVDPYLEQDVRRASGPTLYKRQLSEMTKQYDVITLNHSYEHMEDPKGVMRHLSRLLTKNGQLIISIPKADSFAWRHYGVNWFCLDAPRHFFLHTRKSIEIIAAGAGLVIKEAIDQSDGGQFKLSEQYAKGIHMNDPRFCGPSLLNIIFSWRKNKAYLARAKELNAKGEGDACTFYLSLKN